MAGIDERMALLRTAGIVDDAGLADLEALVRVVVAETGVSRDDAHLASLVTHVAAALRRAAGGEPVEPLPDEVMADVRESSVWPEAVRVEGLAEAEMATRLSEDERGFVLAHLGGLLMSERDAQGGGEMRHPPRAQGKEGA